LLLQMIAMALMIWAKSMLNSQFGKTKKLFNYLSQKNGQFKLIGPKMKESSIEEANNQDFHVHKKISN
jgi:hypothetical protein